MNISRDPRRGEARAAKAKESDLLVRFSLPWVLGGIFFLCIQMFSKCSQFSNRLEMLLVPKTFIYILIAVFFAFEILMAA